MTISQDDRKELTNGAKLLLNGNEYTIDTEIGRGGSCIVYTAKQLCENRIPQTVRVKECFPAYLDISRSADGSLSVPEKSRMRFDASIQRSQRIFSLNQKLRNTNGLTNSTIDSSELVYEKGTVYIVMRCVEGLSYINEVDDCIRSVFIRALALVRVLKKYHENGYLHLDVKPENIFVIPETKEHILLFDFDSMLSFDEIKNGKVRLSCSEGYTAPEVLRMDIRSVNISADIYSVGALVYHKLFGGITSSLSVSDHIEFSGLKFPDKRYQPIFLRKLSTFFSRTLSTSPAARYRSDEELIHSLEELISLSDLNGSQLISNFTAACDCFTGRSAELQRISEAFSRSHIVFLYGSKGSGKTALARQYAAVHSGELNRIIFVDYCHSIEETVNIKIQLTGCDLLPGENSRAYFRRRLRTLRNILNEQDMIILNDLDVDCDENLDEFLQCGCKFLITTSEDYSDFNYEQIYVERSDTVN